MLHQQIRGALAAACLTALAALLADARGNARQQGTAQSPPSSQDPVVARQRPVFRTGAVFVTVDIYPLRDGLPVEGLTAADFDVFEDGVRQEIDSFEIIKAPPFVIDNDRRDPSSQAEGDQLAADPRNRVFVVYVDLYHVLTAEGAVFGRKPLIDFLDRGIGPNDLVGILTPLVPVRQLVLGRKVQVIQASLENYLKAYWNWSLFGNLDPVEERYLAACPGMAGTIISRRRDDMLLSSLEDLVVRLGALRDERKHVILFSDGWQLSEPDLTALARQPRSIPPINVVGGRLTTAPVPGSPNASECDSELARLATMDFHERFRGLLSSAERANVAFSPISPSRLAMFDGSLERAQATADTLRTLANRTNGVAIVHTNDLRGGLARLQASQSAFYLLGYYSTNLATDGKYRRIEVRVKQPRIDVTARRGYTAPTAEALRAGEAAPTSPAVSSEMADALGKLARARVSPDLSTHAVHSRSEIAVAVELGASLVASTWRDGGDVEVTITASDGQNVGTATGRIEPGARAALVRVPADPTPARGRVAVRVSSGSTVLTDRVEVLSRLQTLIGEPLVFRAAGSPRSPFRPVADFHFRRVERLRVEVPILRPLQRWEGRILDSRGQPHAVPVNITQAQATLGTDSVLAADLTLAPIAPGDYVIEIAASTADEIARKLVGIRVTQ